LTARRLAIAFAVGLARAGPGAAQDLPAGSPLGIVAAEFRLVTTATDGIEVAGHRAAFYLAAQHPVTKEEIAVTLELAPLALNDGGLADFFLRKDLPGVINFGLAAPDDPALPEFLDIVRGWKAAGAEPLGAVAFLTDACLKPDSNPAEQVLFYAMRLSENGDILTGDMPEAEGVSPFIAAMPACP
jgi:hypothetical protein